jgi:hypothetical protein
VLRTLSLAAHIVKKRLALYENRIFTAMLPVARNSETSHLSY